jgi:hypothetical protein
MNETIFELKFFPVSWLISGKDDSWLEAVAKVLAGMKFGWLKPKAYYCLLNEDDFFLQFYFFFILCQTLNLTAHVFSCK